MLICIPFGNSMSLMGISPINTLYGNLGLWYIYRVGLARKYKGLNAMYNLDNG